MPYMDAFNKQFETRDNLRHLIRYLETYKHQLNFVTPAWKLDKETLDKAAPVWWSSEITQAVFDACKGIPDDTTINAENLEALDMFWFFDWHLPVYTTFDNEPLHALTISHAPGVGFRVTAYTLPDPNYSLSVIGNGTLMPSHIWHWLDGETVAEMKIRLQVEHDKLYGPGGQFANQEHLTTEQFLEGTDVMARFILAGCVWMRQKVADVSEQPIERHARKELIRNGFKGTPTLRVIQLRKSEAREHVPGMETETHRTYSCQWVVHGHWRNQTFGPKRGQHRLQFIMPYVKGPDDKPLRVAPERIYTVNR